MISSQFERQILRGNAESKILNISESIFNYNIGRGAGVIIESIIIHPFILATFEVDTTTVDIIDTLNKVIEKNYLFSLNVYGNAQEKNLTIKQKISVTSIDVSGGRSLLIFTSNTQHNFDVFWNFQSENVTFEFTDVKDTISNVVTEVLADTRLQSKRNLNPNGFNLPNASFTQYSGGIFNWNVRNMGKNTEIVIPGTTQDGFIIPRNGNGTTGNIISRTIGDLANGNQLIVNVGLIEYNNECLKTL